MIGYSIPVCLWEKDSQPNLEEKEFFETISKITEICQQHLEDEFGPDMASTLNTPVNRFDFLEQHCRVKMALLIEGIFISKTVTSVQINVHEVNVKPLN